MANVDAPNGARVFGHMSGGVHRYDQAVTRIATGYATSIFSGDFVKRVAAGTIEQAAAGERILGVFAGCDYVDSSGNKVYSPFWPASTTATEIKARVITDPNIIWAIQADGAVTEVDIGNLADAILTHAGSTTSGRSGMEVSSTTAATNAQLRIHGKVETPDNAWGANVELLVSVFEHEYSRDDPATPGI